MFPVSEHIRPPDRTSFFTGRTLFVGLLAYFAVQVVLRVACSTSVDLDESEQAVLCQKFCWGYGSDPPLYTWIQMPFFRVFGHSVFALSLLKNLLLLSTYWLTYVTARLVTRNTLTAFAAAISLFYLPGVAWESQRDLTHSIFAATFSLATLFCFLRLHQARRTGWYLLLGCCAGGGLLAKYNYAFWLLGLVVAGFSLRELRPTLLDKRIWLTLGLTLVIFAPNAVWMLSHRQLALLTSSKFNVNESLRWIDVTLLGIRNFTVAVASFSLPLVIIYWLIFRWKSSAQNQSQAGNPDYLRLLVRAWLVIAITLLALVLLARATGFKDRWFQPILTPLPIAAAALVQSRITRRRVRWMAGLSGAVMLAIVVIMPGRLLVAERLRREEPLTRPYAALAAQIQAVLPAQALVVCDTRLLAGNLRLDLHDALVLPPELTTLMKSGQQHCLLIWDATRAPELPVELQTWAAQFAPDSPTNGPPQFFSATYRYHKTKQYRLGLLQLF